MNSRMFRSAAGVIPVRGADLELLDGPLLVDLLGGDAHLLAEELADLAADQGVVAPQRADLGAAPAEGAAVGQLRQPGEGLPVEVDVAALELPQERMFLLDVLADDPAQDLRPHGRPVDVLPAAGDIDRAGVGADLALHAVFQGVDQGLEKRPVVLRREELLQAGQKLVDEGLLLFRALAFQKSS